MVDKRQADWSLAPRGPAGAAVQGALGLAALAVAGEIIGLEAWWATAAAGVGTLCTLAGGAGTHPGALWYRLGCWAGAGGWLTWAIADGVWDRARLATLGVGALAAALLAPLSKKTMPAPAPGRLGAGPGAGALVPRRHTALAADWETRIHRVVKIRVQITDVREWPTKAGVSLLVLLPLGGVTAQRIADASAALASDAALPNGCGVEVTGGPNRRSCWVHVATVNKLAEDLDHHGDYSPRSILQPVALGTYRDGSPMEIMAREPRTIVVGTTGSGKSGTLHTATAELGRCVDNLAWHLDMNGGSISAAWLRDWLDGLLERPPIDWAAPCAEEALLMAHAFVGVALDRKTTYARRRIEADTQLLPVGQDVPQITIITDEAAEILSPSIKDPLVKLIRDAMEAGMRLGREAACNVLLSAIRSISTMVATDVMAMMHNRIIMYGSDAKDIGYLYDHARGVDVQDLAGPGSAFARLWGKSAIRAWRCYKMLPRRDIRPAAAVMSRQRPDLDAPSAHAAGEAYATRHARMRWLFSTEQERCHLQRPEPIELPGLLDDRGRPVIWDPTATHPSAGDAAGSEMEPATPRAVQAAGPAAPATPRLHLVQNGPTAGWSTPEDLARAAREKMPRALPAEPDNPLVRPPLHAEQVHTLGDGDAVAPPRLLVCALLVFERANSTRLHSAELAAALLNDGDGPTELAALLRPLGVRPRDRAFLRGGVEARGYQLGDLQDAADRIARGELQVPAEVAAWPDQTPGRPRTSGPDVRAGHPA